jgi:hypothetical protein
MILIRLPQTPETLPKNYLQNLARWSGDADYYLKETQTCTPMTAAGDQHRHLSLPRTPHVSGRSACQEMSAHAKIRAWSDREVFLGGA